MSDAKLETEMVAGTLHCNPAARHPATALAWSETRADEAEKRGPGIALWLPEGVTVAIGIGQRPEAELEIETARRDGVGLIRRQSGGGAVLLYPGVLCWEAWAGVEEIEKITQAGSGIRPSYVALSRPVVRALCGMGIAAFHAGICDISVKLDDWPHPRKLAGTAQLRRRDKVLVHGSLLVNPVLDILSRYLRFPSEQPDYRQNRSHRDFCVSVGELLPDSRDASFMRRVAGAIAAEALTEGWEIFTPPAILDAAARALETAKYLSDKWNWEKFRQR